MTPINERLRHANLFMKGTASLVLAAFLSLTLQPLALAANTPAPARIAPKDESTEEKLGRALHALTDEVERLEEKLDKREDTAREDDNIKRLSQDIDGLDVETLKGFDEVARHIRERNLPPVIMERHTEAVNRYRQHIAALKANVTEVAGEKDRQKRKAKAAELKRLMEKDKRPARTPLDPNKLPFRIPEGKVRKPKETAHELRAAIAPNDYKVASATFDVSLLAPVAYAPPSAADLAPTEDAQMTPEIRALAAELGHNPVKIYNWVHNNIRFLPTYGSIQGSHLTLLAKQGNAFDTASLLIALLRASNIHARYAYGTVEIPIDKAMNWVGGVKNADAALELLAQGGIPSIAVIAGGRIGAVRIEHVWVEAHVDFYPSRGAIHKRGDTWVQMDGSFKQYAYTPPMDIKNNVPFDAASFVDQINRSAQINQQEGWVAGIDQAFIDSRLLAYRDSVDAYVQNQRPSATVGDLLGTQTIRASHASVLPSAVPYKVLVSTSLSALTQNLRHYVELGLYATASDIALENPALSYVASLPAIAGKRTTLTFEPATPDDAAVIQSAFDNGATTFPAYLVNAIPQLRLEDDVVASAPPGSLGVKQKFVISMLKPWTRTQQTYEFTSGDHVAFGINAGGVTGELYEQRTVARDLAKGEVANFTSEMLYQVMLAWWAERNSLNEILGDTMGLRYYQLPSHGATMAPLTVRYLFGIPRTASYKSRVIDVRENVIMAVADDSSPSTKARFGLISGNIGSYLESSVLDQAFLKEPGTSFSATEGFRIANAQGIPIYTITSANLASALAAIQLDSETEQEIFDGVSAGLVAYAPQREVNHNGFRGAGYMIVDPATGGGPRKITGGFDGANSPAPEAVFPMPQIPSLPILGLLTRSTLRSANASLVTQNGVVIGVAIPATLPTAGVGAGGGARAPGLAGAVMAALIVVKMLSEALIREIDRLYPPTEKKYRKYSRQLRAVMNGTTGLIRESERGTFGRGVYLAGQDAVSCPPTAEQAANAAVAYELPTPEGPHDPALAEAYIDIVVTRENFYEIQERKNNKGTTEYLVTSPLVPITAMDRVIYRFLYVGPGAFGIEIENRCYGF